LKLSAEKARLERSRYVHSTVRNRLPRRAAELGRWFPKREIALGRGAVRLQGRVLASCQQARASSAGAQGYDGVVRLLYGLPRVDLRPTQTHALSSCSLRPRPAAMRRSGNPGAQAVVSAARPATRGSHRKPCTMAMNMQSKSSSLLAWNTTGHTHNTAQLLSAADRSHIRLVTGRPEESHKM